MVEPINILLIEDNPGDVRLVQEIFKNVKDLQFNIFVVNRLSEGLKQIVTKTIHVILLDLNLPDSEGLDTFRKTQRFAINIPVVILSVLSNKELIYTALLEGAQDYLIKGEYESEALVRVIKYAMWRHRSEIME
jgi:two-component system sensor histidine kinase UhpB